MIYFDNIEPERRDGLLSRLRRISYAPIVVLTDQYTEQDICYLTSFGADLILFSNEQACFLFGSILCAILALSWQMTRYLNKRGERIMRRA